MSPRSTRLTGYSGSSTSARAARRSCGEATLGGPREIAVAAPGAARRTPRFCRAPRASSARAPGPRDRTVLEEPALLRLVELGRERAVDHVLMPSSRPRGAPARPAPIDSQNGTAVDIQSCRRVSLLLPFQPEPSCSLCRFRSSGRPNHSSVMMNIQSTARLKLRLVLGILGEGSHPALPVPEVERLLAVDLDEGALPGPVGSVAGEMSLRRTKPARS